LGTFLLLAAVWFLLMKFMARLVDMESKPEKESALYRWLLQKTVAAVLPILGVRVHREGFDQPIPEGRFLLVCNHLHDIDPAFILRYFPNSQLAFIAKREVAEMPLIGPFLKMTMGQFVNRENDREALKTILECIRLIKEDIASVAVFPEGYIRPNRLLHPFRPGVFKIAQKAKVPIVVCTLRDTHKAIGTILKLKKATVTLHILEVISPQWMEGKSTVEIADRVYGTIAADLGAENCYPEENT
jgi:1-acyl-sn-glycerol-3-phosphate acyltransferase